MSNLTLSSPRLSWRGWYCHVVNGSTVWGTRCGFTRTQAVVRAARLLVRLTAGGSLVCADDKWEQLWDWWASRDTVNMTAAVHSLWREFGAEMQRLDMADTTTDQELTGQPSTYHQDTTDEQ